MSSLVKTLRRQAIEQEVGRSRGVHGGGADLARHIQKGTARSGKPAGEAGGYHRVRVGGPGQIGCNRLEPAGGVQEEWRRVAATPRDIGDLGSHQVDAGALELAERPGFGHGEQLEPGVQGTCLDLGLGRGQRPCRPLGRIGRQYRRSLQERRVADVGLVRHAPCACSPRTLACSSASQYTGTVTTTISVVVAPCPGGIKDRRGDDVRRDDAAGCLST
jgi:hypothetical protein